MSDDEAPKDVPPTPPPGGQYPPNWGSAYPPPPPGQYPPNYGSAYPPPPGGQYPPGYAGYPVTPKHPQATTAMILGILSLVLCGVIGPFAWVMGSKAVKEIDANPHAYSGRGEANAGKIMGIIGTALLAFGVLIVVALAVIGLAAGSTSSNFEYSGMGAF